MIPFDIVSNFFLWIQRNNAVTVFFQIFIIICDLQTEKNVTNRIVTSNNKMTACF